MVGREKFHLDRRRLVHAQRFHRVEIRLHDAPAIDADRLAKGRAQTVERRALRLILGAARIDDLAADVTDNPDVIKLDLAGGCDCRLHDFREVAEMAEIERDTFARPSRQGITLVPL